MEIEAALHRRIWVIPVLLESTPMPSAAELPGRLVELTRRNALRVRSEQIRGDIRRLLSVVEELVGGTASEAQPSSPILEQDQDGSLVDLGPGAELLDVRRERGQRGRLLYQLRDVYAEYLR